MKRFGLGLAVLCLVIASTASAQVDGTVGKLGVGVNGGLMIPASGDFTIDSSFSDYFGVGPGFGAHLTYTPVKEFTLRGGFTYTFMKLKDEVRGDMSEEPYFSAPYAYVDGVFNLGSFIKAEKNIVNPYILAGGGVYFWKVTDDGVNGDPITFPYGAGTEEWKGTSFGAHFGAGVEVFVTPALSLFAEGKYHLMITKDEDKFGDDFANLGAIDAMVGLTYHFPIAGK
ncbi:MAG: outer membrane beta-barrel protein [candidate division Zixibacteria bacterium]|nr:outer membrane beta-barrel protein [candidate division Zixibacteria bacterium]